MQMKKIADDSAIMKLAEVGLNQFCVAVYDTANEGQVKNPVATKADKIFGVLRTDGHAAGKTAEYDFVGKTKVMIASAVTIGETAVIADTAGRVRMKDTSAGDKELPVLGTFEEAKNTAGSIVIVSLQINNSTHS